MEGGKGRGGSNSLPCLSLPGLRRTVKNRKWQTLGQGTRNKDFPKTHHKTHLLGWWKDFICDLCNNTVSISLQSPLFYLGLNKGPNDTVNPALQQAHKLITGWTAARWRREGQEHHEVHGTLEEERGKCQWKNQEPHLPYYARRV